MSRSSVDNSLWCRQYHPVSDAAMRLVCFPHAGGSASYYFPVSAALSGAQIDVVAIQYPGRQDRRTEPLVDDPPDEAGHSTADALSEAAEAARLVHRLLDCLDGDRRAVFVLAELEQMTAPEIAAALGVNLNTVYSRLRLARRDFDAALARYRARRST